MHAKTALINIFILFLEYIGLIFTLAVIRGIRQESRKRRT